jgi:YegS/Rv2252/BmrU family lipid kinase
MTRLRRVVVIQRNPKSGTGRRKHLLFAMIRRLRELGFRPRCFRHRDRLDQWLAMPDHRQQVACIVAAGGDGTVADLINRHPSMKLALLPLGNENLLARYLGVPACGRAAAEIVARGGCRTLDLCQVNGRRFALMASAGFDAEVVRVTHETRVGHVSRISYIKPIWNAMRKYKYPVVRVRVDDDPPVEGRLAVVVNVPAYALRLPVARASDACDGQVDVRVFQRGSTFQMLRYFCMVAIGRHERLSDVVCRAGKRVRIDADTPVPLQIDGDPAGTTPAEIQVLPRALEVYAP